MRHQLVIRSGTILDGTGGAPYEADIAVDDGVISQIGEVTGRSEEEIDATGRVVTPGFVDIHTHYDAQITWEHRLVPSALHGVTTVLMGNCGVGFAPCRPEHRGILLELMEGVEDIPEAVMAAGLPWNWESFPDFLDALDQREADIDFATQVPHSPVRVFVMGERGAAREAPTGQDLERMTRIVREAIEAGALGVSTSRNLAHRTVKGDLAPSVTTEEDELLALARGLRAAGQGVFQLIPRMDQVGDDALAEFALLRRVAEEAQRPLSFSLLMKDAWVDDAWAVLAALRQANEDGLAMKAQIFPRPLGLVMGLELSLHPFRHHPSYKAITHLPLAERVAILRQPETRARILAEQAEHTNPVILRMVNGVENLFPLDDPPDYEPPDSSRIATRAAALGISTHELLYDLLLEKDGHAMLLYAATNYVGRNLETVRAAMGHEDTLISLGDGGAHYGMISDASFPTTMLAYWTRDRPAGRGPRLGAAEAVRKLTRDNALAIGLGDRGLLAPGYKADINVIDYDRLLLHAPTLSRDLPAGGLRLNQAARGYDATIVSGQVVYRHGEHSGALPGRLVRGARGGPVATA